MQAPPHLEEEYMCKVFMEKVIARSKIELQLPRLGVYTSLLFITNVGHAFYARVTWLHHAWVLVLATSLLYHGAADDSNAKNKVLLRRIDQGAVIVLVTIGGVYWLLIPFAYKAGALALFAACVVFYGYGFYKRCYCFARPPYDKIWHSIMHVAAVAGHHIIISGGRFVARTA